VLRPSLEPQQAPDRAAVARVATEAVAGFGGIGDQPAAREVRGKFAGRDGMAKQLALVLQRAPADVPAHLAAVEMNAAGDLVGAFLRPLDHGAERSDA